MANGMVREEQLRSVRNFNNAAIMTFRDITTRNQAAELKNAVIEIDRSDHPVLRDNEYFHDQVIGLSVLTDRNEAVGTVTGIIETGANDIYVVSSSSGEIMIPAVKEFISEIDTVAKRMIITPIDGMLDLTTD